MEDLGRYLCELLSEVKVTFSKNCVSGLIGDMCRCWRCRGVEFDEQEPGWARVASLVSKGYQAEFSLELRISRSEIDVVGSRPSSQETAKPSPGSVSPRPGPRH